MLLNNYERYWKIRDLQKNYCFNNNNIKDFPVPGVATLPVFFGFFAGKF